MIFNEPEIAAGIFDFCPHYNNRVRREIAAGQRNEFENPERLPKIFDRLLDWASVKARKKPFGHVRFFGPHVLDPIRIVGREPAHIDHARSTLRTIFESAYAKLEIVAC